MPPRLQVWYAALMTHTPIREVRDEWTNEDWGEFWTIVELSPKDKDRRPFDWALPVVR